MVNVRLCFIEMGSWLNYIIFVGCLYAINTDALPVFFLEGSWGLPELFKLLGKSTEKMTLKDLENSFNRATEVLCISETDVTKIKESCKLTGKRNTEDSYLDALKEIASDHREVVFTLLKLNRFKLPTDEDEYNSAIEILNTMEGSKSPKVVAAIEAGDKKISTNKGAEAYSEAFRKICEAWFAVIEVRDRAVLNELGVKPPETLLELPFIFERIGKVMNDCRGLLVAKEALSDFRTRLEMMESTSVTSLYDHQQITDIIEKVLTLEENLEIRIIHLSKKKINLIKSSTADLLPDLRDRDPNTEDSTEIEELKSVSTKNPTNKGSTKHKKPEYEQLLEEDKDNDSGSFEKKIQLAKYVQKYVTVHPVQSLEKTLFAHYVNCRFMMISYKSEQIDYINDMLKEEGRTHNDFCYSWMYGYQITSVLVLQPGVAVKGGPTKKEKLEAIKGLEGRMIGRFGIYNLAKIIYNLPKVKAMKNIKIDEDSN